MNCRIGKGESGRDEYIGATLTPAHLLKEEEGAMRALPLSRPVDNRRWDEGSQRPTCHWISARFIFLWRLKHKLPIFMRPPGRKKFIPMRPGRFGGKGLTPHGNGQN
jgi:hypothetical protein